MGKDGPLLSQVDYPDTTPDAHATELARLNRVLRTLSGGNRALLTATSEDGLFQVVCDVIVERGGYRAAWAGYALDDADKTFQVVAVAGAAREFATSARITWSDDPHGRGPTGTAARTGKPAVSQDIAADPGAAAWREELAQAGYAAVLSLPLQLDGRTIGALTIAAAERDAFDGEAFTLFEEMAADVSFGIKTIRERKARELAEDRLRYLVHFDPDTDLPNRTAFREGLARRIEEARSRDQTIAALSLRLQNTSTITDAYGRPVFSRLIAAIGQILRSSLRADDLLARTGNGIFGIAIAGASLDQALEITDTLRDKLREPVVVDGMHIPISVAAGVAMFPDHAAAATDLLRRSEVAMRVARRRGLPSETYRAEFEDQSRNMLSVTAGIRAGLEAGEFRLFYQPKVNLTDGRIGGAEALIRWAHPERGMVPPGQFIPAAEQTGLITSVTEFVLQTAMRQAYGWQQAGFRQRIAVNVTAQSFFEAELPDRLKRSLATWGAAPDMILLEITESTLMADADAALRILGQLRDIGIEISIDDFGTGYSSLSYLQRFPANEIKLDLSFVRAAARDPVSLRIVEAVVELSHDLGKRVVAEGVETRELAVLMRDAGCDVAQGYYFAKPMPEPDYIGWLTARQASRSAGAS